MFLLKPFIAAGSAFKFIVIDDIVEKFPDLKSVPPLFRKLGVFGFALLVLLISLTLVFFWSKGSLARTWVDLPPIPDGSSNGGNLTLSFAGPIGFPPFAGWICVGAIAVAWGFLMTASRFMAWLPSMVVLALFGVQLSFFTMAADHFLNWIALGFILLAALAWRHLPARLRDRLPAWSDFPFYALLPLLFFGILVVTEGAFILSVGLVSSQMALLFVLSAYWLMLGMDTVDSGLTVGKWSAQMAVHRLPRSVAGWFVPLIRGLFVVGILAYYILLAMQGTSVNEVLLFAVPPVITFAFFTVWDLLGMGGGFVSGDSSALPKPARLLLLIGWTLLASTTMLFFFSSGDDTFEKFSGQVSTEAVLVSGIPLVLYLLFTEMVRLKRPGYCFGRTPVVIFILLSLGILFFLGFKNNLSFVKFAQAALYTNRADVLQESDPQKAEELYLHTIQLDPTAYKARFNLGNFYHARQDFEKAREAYEETVKINSDFVQAYVNLGVVYSTLNQDDKAEEAYYQALELDPKLAFAHNNLGLLFMHKQNWEEAYGHLIQAVEVSTEERAIFYGNLAQAEFEVGKWEDGVKHLERASELDPDDSGYHLSLGLLYNKWGTEMLFQGKNDAGNEFFQKALRAYETALEKGADDFFIGTNLSQLYLDLGESAKGEALVRQTIVKYPDDANLQVILGMLLHSQEKKQEAREAYQVAKKLQPTDPNPWANQALIDMEDKKYQEAADGYSEAIRLGGKTSYIHFNLGLSLANLGRYDEALQSFQTVVDRKDHNEKAALEHMGTIYFEMGLGFYNKHDHTAAVPYFQKAALAFPSFINSYAFLGLSYDSLGQRELAKKAYADGLKECKTEEHCDLLKKALEAP